MKKTYANYLSTKLILKTAQQYVYTQTIGWPIVQPIVRVRVRVQQCRRVVCLIYTVQLVL
jgi:hypothetical protein